MKYMRTALTLIISITFIFLQQGCGGGGSSDTTSTTDTGVFKDSNVSGLAFSSGDETGVTGADGQFIFETGNDVTFSVGGVTIGTASGQSVITPLELVPNGTLADTEVQNIARFVQMLDIDGDPTNGITISQAVQDIAETWPQVDFSDADLDTQLTSIISDASSVDGIAHVLPTVQEATDHLFDTFLCIHAGAFRGNYSGDDSGVFGVLVNAGTGIVEGVAYSTIEDVFIGLSGSAATSLDESGTFIAGTTTDGATFSGQFTSPDTMTGTWELLTFNDSGTFSGSRLGGSDDAVLRFTGTFVTTVGLPAAGLFTFDINETDEVTGIALTIAAADGTTNETIGLTGTLNGETLNVQTVDGDATIVGTLNRTTGTLSGTWSDSDGNSGTFQGSGCTLNPVP